MPKPYEKTNKYRINDQTELKDANKEIRRLVADIHKFCWWCSYREKASCNGYDKEGVIGKSCELIDIFNKYKFSFVPYKAYKKKEGSKSK